MPKTIHLNISRIVITGHLLQVGAGYLVHHDFQTSYLKYLANGIDYLDSEDYAISYPDNSMAQAKLDRTYLDGMLVSSNRRDGERKLLLKHQRTHDGILAWIEFLCDYDNHGSEEIRITKLESLINDRFSSKYPGGLIKYIDTLQANLNELDTLLTDSYSDGQKFRILYRNLIHVQSLKHLLQTCKDQKMSYQAAATYLQANSAESEESQDLRQI